MSAVTAAELLDKAAEVLERDGWGRGSYHLPDGSHCAVGGMYVAMRELGIQTVHKGLEPSFQAARETLRDLLDAPVTTWNDEKALDGADVVNHLRKAAEIARGGAES